MKKDSSNSIIPIFLSIFLFGICLSLNGQTLTKEQINLQVEKIDNDTTLQTKEFDAAEIYNQTTDGGGEIKVYFDENGIKKMHQQIGLSYGRFTTIIHFENNQPIKIMEREENFKVLENNTGLDYSELIQVFQEDIYILEWEMAETESIKQGQRIFTEVGCGIFEYEPLMELGKELIHR